MKVEIEGKEVEVFTAEEVQAREATVRTEVEGEYKPKLTQVEQEREEARKALAERTGEFKQFRKLNDEQVEKLSAAERTIYENQLAMAEKDAKLEEANKKAYATAVDSAISARVGNNPEVFKKVKDMYSVISLEDSTPEQIAIRVNAALGALGTTAPDLLASVGIIPGAQAQPPVEQKQEKSFADTDRGKAIANDLGLIIEEPKK